MDKNSLWVIIVEIVCGLVCIGLGVYYIFCGAATQVAVFMLVGVGCFVVAMRKYFIMRKQKKDKEKDEKDDTSKQ